MRFSAEAHELRRGVPCGDYCMSCSEGEELVSSNLPSSLNDVANCSKGEDHCGYINVEGSCVGGLRVKTGWEWLGYWEM